MSRCHLPFSIDSIPAFAYLKFGNQSTNRRNIDRRTQIERKEEEEREDVVYCPSS